MCPELGVREEESIKGAGGDSVILKPGDGNPAGRDREEIGSGDISHCNGDREEMRRQ